jgi:CRP-like cAMP-binding protein
MLNDLPNTLKEELLNYQYGGLVDTIPFLKDNEDTEFVWALVQKVSRMKWAKDDPIYWKDDIAESFYLIYKGSVKMLTESNV